MILTNVDLIKSKLKKIIESQEVVWLSDLVTLQTELNIEFSNIIRKTLDTAQIQEDVKILTVTPTNGDPTPFDR